MGWWHSTSYFPCRHVLHSHTHNCSRSLIDSLTQGHLRPLSLSRDRVGDLDRTGQHRQRPTPCCETPEDIGVATRKDVPAGVALRGATESRAPGFGVRRPGTISLPSADHNMPQYTWTLPEGLQHDFPEPIWQQIGILWFFMTEHYESPKTINSQ